MYHEYCVRRLPDSGMLIRLHKRNGYYYEPDPIYVVTRLYEGRNLGPDNCFKTVTGVVHRDHSDAWKELEQIVFSDRVARPYADQAL